ncbi:MAG: metallophosphoesterase [candidate division KSB1 bacterium]|nr:metallophosphoesterase [candidate division KSB1 bacterium]
MQKPVMITILLLILIVAGALVYGFVFERTGISVEEISIDSEKIKHPVRVVHISDLHIYRLSSFEKKIVQKVNSLRPDIIAVTGDLFLKRELWENTGNDFETTLAHVSKFMETLQAKDGVYLCRGNNDISNDKEKSDLLLKEMQRIGVTVLSNRIKRISVNGNSLALLGVDDPELKDVSDFWINTDRDNQVLQTNAKSRNSYTHVMRFDQSWKNYTVYGRFRQFNPNWSGIGVTFYSQMDKGFDHFYRIRRRAGKDEFVLSPHNTRVWGETVQTLSVHAETWYQFKIRVTHTAGQTRINAVIWPEGEQQPEQWAISAFDTSITRLNGGSVGFWSAGQGINQFDDVRILDQAGDTLAGSDFEGYERGTQPARWIDFNYEEQAVPVMADQISVSIYKILLAHSPKAFEYSRESSVDLQLSGHTHGGQIRLPFVGSPVVWRNKMESMYSQGLFQENNTTLYVNRGLGTAWVPIRLFCPPEITVIELK